MIALNVDLLSAIGKGAVLLCNATQLAYEALNDGDHKTKRHVTDV